MALLFPAGVATSPELTGAAAAPKERREALPAAQLSEEALCHGALRGDCASWSALIARHNHKVVVSLLGRGVPLERARELAQEVWLRLIESQRAGRLGQLVLPGLAIVQAGFLSQNEWRSRARTADTVGAEQELADATCAAAPEQPEELAIQRQRLAQVRRALATCPESARRVFEYVYSHPELTYEQVALKFQLSAQRTKQIVCEVRKRLRQALEEE